MLPIINDCFNKRLSINPCLFNIPSNKHHNTATSYTRTNIVNNIDDLNQIPRRTMSANELHFLPSENWQWHCWLDIRNAFCLWKSKRKINSKPFGFNWLMQYSWKTALKTVTFVSCSFTPIKIIHDDNQWLFTAHIKSSKITTKTYRYLSWPQQIDNYFDIISHIK